MHAIPDQHTGLSVTRRKFLRSGALSAAIVPALSAWDLPAVADTPTAPSFAPNADLLRSAKSTAEWIRSAQREGEHGLWWLPDPDHPEKLTTVSAANAIYSGSAGEPEYQLWTDRLTQGVIQSGIPENLTPGYWNVVCQCCGSAAVIDLFLGLWAASGRAEYLSFAQRVAGQLASHATNLDGKGDRWYQAWTRVKPWEVNAETGYSIGASRRWSRSPACASCRARQVQPDPSTG